MINFTPLSPVFLTIGPISLHYYGLMYVLGFSFAYFLIPKLAKARGLKIDAQIFENIFFYTVISALLTARLFYVLFYNFAYYQQFPFKIIAVWEGGMASHGGFIGAILAFYFLTKKYKIPFWQLGDIFVIPIGIGLMLGRFGNFINGELVGRITDMPFCFNFDNYDGCRHPSQLYAAFKDLLIFSIMFYFHDSKWQKGSLSLLFFSLYASFRFIVEFFREPDTQIGYLSLGLSQGQWISIIMLFVCLITFILKNIRHFRQVDKV